MASVRLVVAGLLLAIVPVTVSAQQEAFVDAAQALARAAQPATAGETDVVNAAARLTTALATWDDAIESQRARSSHEVAVAPPARRFQLHVELGVSFSARGRLQDALHEFDAAADLQPSSSDVQLLRALTLESMGMSEAAGRAFQAAWTRDPGNAVKAYYVLQHPAQAGTDETERARAVLTHAYDALRTAAARPSNLPFVTLAAVPDTVWHTPVVGNARTGPAFALLAEGHYDEAVARLAQPAVGIARSSDPFQRFAQAQIDETENHPAAARAGYVAALTGALAGRSTIQVAIGRLAQVEGDAPAAIDAFARAVRLNPNDPTMRQELANAYASVGRVDDAFAELVAGLLVNPANASLHAAVGHLRLDAGDAVNAIPAFTRALDLRPDQYEVRNALATAFSRTGNTTAAAQQLELFERTRREMLERRRQDIQLDVDRENAIRRGLPNHGETP
jgi:tetratricopeptide (TPR) repeat protein